MILVLGILAAAGLATALWLLPAFRFLRNYEQKLASSRPYIQPRELTLGGVEIHVYTPLEQTRSTLLIVPGLHPDGIFDRRFTAFAETCAESGFQVVAPDIVEFRNFNITGNSLTGLRNVMTALPHHLPGGTMDRIGLLGISYGAGPAFLLAAERRFDFVVSIGGYYNLLHALEYSFTGSHQGGPRRKTHEWGRLIFALNHLQEVAAHRDQEILGRSLSLRLKLQVKEAELLEKELSAAGKELLDGILGGLTESQKNTFIEISNSQKEKAAALSPEQILSRIDPATRIYLLHGTNDDSIPYEETIELNAALKGAGFEPRSLITPALTHVDFTNVSEIVELLKLLHWERFLLREAG